MFQGISPHRHGLGETRWGLGGGPESSQAGASGPGVVGCWSCRRVEVLGWDVLVLIERTWELCEGQRAPPAPDSGLCEHLHLHLCREQAEFRPRQWPLRIKEQQPSPSQSAFHQCAQSLCSPPFLSPPPFHRLLFCGAPTRSLQLVLGVPFCPLCHLVCPLKCGGESLLSRISCKIKLWDDGHLLRE